MNKKTIIHNIPFGFYLGGGERLLKAWNDNPVKNSNTYLIYEKNKNNISCYDFNNFNILEHTGDFKGLNSVLKSLKGNVVVEHGIGWRWDLFNTIYKDVKIKKVFYIHNEKLFRFMEEAEKKKKDTVIKKNIKHIISNYEDEYLRNSKINYIVAPLQLDITKYPFIKRKYDINKIKVGIVGRISDEKIPLSFIKELKKFSKNNKQFSFHFLGAGLDHLTILKKEIRNSKNIFYEGFLKPDEMNSFYKKIDILLSPSLSESGGYAILEAMATGLPAITRSAGALKETVGYGGLTAENNTDKELFNNLLLLNHNDNIKFSGELARNKILEFNANPKEQFKKLNKFILS